MNRFFFFIRGDAKTFVLCRRKDAFALYSVSTVQRELFVGEEVRLGKEHIGVGPLWLQSCAQTGNKRDAMVFNPALPPGDNKEQGVYNLFQGLAIDRRAAFEWRDSAGAQAAPFFEHIRLIWCQGDDRLFQYVLRWFASIVQHPEQRMATALVLKSAEGAGKGIVVQKVAEILGRTHLCHTTSMDDVLGSFNECLKGKLLVFLDECTWGGNHRDAGTIKKLITEETIHINEKFKPRYAMQNCANFVIASNEDWVVPAGLQSRRFLCLRLDDRFAGALASEQAQQHFAALRACPAGAIAHVLYSVDLRGFEPRDVPVTELLQDQQSRTLGSEAQFVLGLIESSSRLLGTECAADELYRHYCDETRGRASSRVVFLKQIALILGVRSRQARDGGGRYYCLKLPDKEAAKQLFRAFMRDPGWAFVGQDEGDSADLQPVEQ
jgi:putative DNA primase/helicase